MPVCRIAHQVHRKPIRRALQHAKSLPKHQVTHDVKHQPITPIRHIPRRAPPFRVLLFLPTAALLANHLARGPDICEDVLLERLDGSVRESVGKHATFPRMAELVDGAVDIICILVCREGRIEVCLLDVRLVPIDGFQRCVAVYREAVWAYADEFPCGSLAEAERELVQDGF